MDDDASTMSAGAPTPPSRPAGEPPGLRSQIGATIDAVKRLFRAHVDLAKTEVGEIAGSVTRMVGLFGAALGIVIAASILLFVGGILFLGEWLFGSIGWGVLLGFLLFLDIAVVLVLLALDIKGGRIGAMFLVAAAVGAVVGVVLALDLPHRGWDALGATLLPQVTDPNRTFLLAVGSLAALGVVLGLALGLLRGGTAGERIKAGIILAIVLGAFGAFVGWLTTITIAWQVGLAIGLAVTLLIWPILLARSVQASGVDGETLKQKFIPNQTIELTKETIEWVRARTPLVPKS